MKRRAALSVRIGFSAARRAAGVALLALGLARAIPSSGAEITNQPVRLDECIRQALLQNRDLQIERLNPDIAGALLSGSYGYFDPVLGAEARREESSDTGGFDPADFSRDAIYDADSEVANAGVTGFLPTGLNYSLAGTYANSYGSRNGLEFDSYKVFAGITVRQPLLRNAWIDVGRYTIQVNKRNLKISELGVRFVALDVINRVQQAYYEFAQAYEFVGVQGELLDARKRLLAGTVLRVRQGLGTVPDEQLARAQLAGAEAVLVAARTSLILAENDLRTQIGDDFTNQVQRRLEPVDPLLLIPGLFDLSQSWRRGLDGRPDLAQMREEVEKSKINIRFRRNQMFPSLDLVASYGRKGASVAQVAPAARARASASAAFNQIGDASAPSEMVGVLFSVPLGGISERAEFRASRHLKAQAELRLKQKEEFVLREISDAFHMAQMSLERAEVQRKSVAAAQAVLRSEERRLLGGTSTVFLVLQFQSDLVNAQAAEIRARADYNKALTQLGFAEASLLESKGISVVVR